VTVSVRTLCDSLYLSVARTPGAWPTRWPTRRGPQGRREGCRRIVASQVLTCMAVSRFPCCTGRRGSARLWWTASMAALCGRGRGAHASRPGRGRHSRPLCTPPGRQQPHRPDARCLPRSMRARVDHVPAIGPFHSFVGRSTIILTGARGSCQAQECPARRESILPGASTSQFSYRQKNLQPADRLFCWHSIVRKIDALDEGSSRSAFRPGAVRELPGLPFHTCSGAWLWVTGLSHLPRIFGLKSAKKHAIRTDGSWWKSIATHLHLFFPMIRDRNRDKTRIDGTLIGSQSPSRRAEDGDHGHGHGHPPPLPPPYAPSQKRRQSQARHPAPLGRQPTSTWPRHADYEPPHPPLPPSQKIAILISPPPTPRTEKTSPVEHKK